MKIIPKLSFAFGLFSLVASATSMGPQFAPPMAGGISANFVASGGVAANPGAYTSSYQGMGDIPAYAIPPNVICQDGRFVRTNQFQFGAQGNLPGGQPNHFGN